MEGRGGNEISGTNRSYKLLFVVCHPDDEALWVGGLVHALSKFSFLKVFVLCLSGGDIHSPRSREFEAARAVAGYAGGLLMEGKLLSALQPLPNIASLVEKGIGRLSLSIKDISLLVTHSPYGDEHLHPHHRQAFGELFKWSQVQGVPFGYFSGLPMPFLNHLPLLRNAKRLESLHLLNFARCTPARSLIGIVSRALHPHLRCPKYYLQFLVDIETKRKMLNCYQSIDLAAHASGYAAFTGGCESVYCFSDSGLEPLKQVMDHMEVPGADDLFRNVAPTTVRHTMRRALARFAGLKI